MKPTLGRIVLYLNGSIEYAAIVTHVTDRNDENVIHLTYFPPFEAPQTATWVHEWKELSPSTGGPWWKWPPRV